MQSVSASRLVSWLRHRSSHVRAFLAGALLFPLLALTGPIGLPFVLAAFLTIVFWDSVQDVIHKRRAAALQRLVREAEAARTRREWSLGSELLARAESLARHIPTQHDYNLAAVQHRRAPFAPSGRPDRNRPRCASQRIGNRPPDQ